MRQNEREGGEESLELSFESFFFFLYVCVGKGLDGYSCSESVDIVGMCEWFVMEQELAGHTVTTLLPHQANKKKKKKLPGPLRCYNRNDATRLRFYRFVFI